jgi:Amt family ammonium transporter
MSTAGATLSWMLTEWYHRGKPTVLGAATGCIAGLGTITPASGFVTPPAALAIGQVAGVVCYIAVMLEVKFRYDDSLDVVGIHGVGGTLGMLATGLFATVAVNAGGSNGLIYGNPRQFSVQALAIGVILVHSFVATYGILKFLEKTMGLRVTDEQEVMGLDLFQHGEAGYN